MLKRLFQFGGKSIEALIKYLFVFGNFIIMYNAYAFGKSIYLTTYYEQGISYIQEGQRWYTTEKVNNLPLGIVGSIAYFIITLVIWKVICELLYIIFERVERR